MDDNNFSNRQPRIIGEDQIRKYAVLVPIFKTEEGIFILFEKRSHQLRNQPGEISFPGGKLEANESLVECAIRETIEELNIDRQQIEIIGPGDIFISPFNMIIYPFIGVLIDYNNTFNKEEVSEVVKVPLDFFFSQQPSSFVNSVVSNPPENFPYEWIPYGKNYSWSKGDYEILFYKYENIIIWGITARIVKSMISLMEEYHLFEEKIKY